MQYPLISSNAFWNPYWLEWICWTPKKEKGQSIYLMGLKWISLALIDPFPWETPTEHQHRPVRFEGKAYLEYVFFAALFPIMKSQKDRYIMRYPSISSNAVWNPYWLEWICWTPKKRKDNLLPDGSEMDFPGSYRPFPMRNTYGTST